jgi:hypothetical protein
MSDVYPSQGLETRLVRETTLGTTPGSPTWKRLNGIGIRLGASITANPVRIPGALVPTDVTIDDDFSVGDVEGRVDFNSAAYVLSSLFGPATITALGGSPAAYQWAWLWGGRRPNRPVSYSVYNGFAESSDLATGFVFNSLSIGGGRGDGFDLSGDGFARALTAGQNAGGITAEVQTITENGTVSGGTFTITIVEVNETTAAIAYDANAAAIQAAIDALPSILPGDIVVAGGPISTTPATFTYRGYFAGRNVAALTVDGALLTGGGSYDVTTTTPGADAVVDVPVVPAGAVMGNIYLDTTWAGLGTTQLLHAYNMDLSIGERMSRVRPINKSLSSDSVIDVGEQDHTLTLTLGRNAVADAQLARLRNGTKVFPRVEWEGDTISGANEYRLMIDACINYTEIGMPDDNDNVSVRDFTGTLAIDETSGNVIQVTLVNTLSGL